MLARGGTVRAEDARWRMPDEGAPHAATWMAFGPSAVIWGNKLLPAVRENLAQIAKAKLVCNKCPVTHDCLAWAISSGQDAGVWGGMSEDERRALKRRNNRGRTRTRATV